MKQTIALTTGQPVIPPFVRGIHEIERKTLPGRAQHNVERAGSGLDNCRATGLGGNDLTWIRDMDCAVNTVGWVPNYQRILVACAFVTGNQREDQTIRGVGTATGGLT